MTPTQTPQDALAAAQTHAQAAVAVELYTLPFYLSALGSIKDTKSAAFATLLSVCTEEMLHLQLAANICLALGISPNFTAPQYGPDITPTFPDGTPILDPAIDPATGDSGAIHAVIGNLQDALPTMLDIEVPTEFEPDRTAPPYDSIGQFYTALKQLATLADTGPGVVPWTTKNQVGAGPYFKKQSFPLTITNLADLTCVVEVICEQGEGKAQTPPPTPPFKESDFTVPDSDDRLAGVPSDPSDQNQFNHFGRFISLQNLAPTTDTYTGTAAPDSNENKTLQNDFSIVIKSLNDLWAGNGGDFWVMTKLLPDAIAVWMQGNIPQWTAVSDKP